MMLRIACTCGHTGVVSAESLPRSLTCSRCGSCRYVKGEDGTRIVNRVGSLATLVAMRLASSRVSRCAADSACRG
jgi:hypothetical protein